MHDEMKMPDLAEVCQIEKDLISALKTVVSHGIFSKEVDKEELGELVDMVKDMAETKKNCWEACYYETVTKAMEEYGDDGGWDSMGYNRNRYTSGQYAPRGTGDRTSGYVMPMVEKMHRPMPPVYYDNDIMGYSGERGGNQSSSNMRNTGNGSTSSNGSQSYGYPYDHDNKYGLAFEEYEDAKRHYTESKSLEDKSHMDEKALEHVNHSMMTLREIWKNADPTVKKEVSSAVASLASEFKTV